MSVLCFFFLHALDPENVGADAYIDQESGIGSCANNHAQALNMMRFYEQTKSLQLNNATSVFQNPQVFSGFTVHEALTHKDKTIIRFENKSTRSFYRAVLDTVWEKAKEVEAAIVQTWKRVLESLTKTLDGFKSGGAKKTHTIKPEHIDGSKYHNKDPLIGANASNADEARALMKDYKSTEKVPLNPVQQVFNNPRIFDGYEVKEATIHKGQTIMRLFDARTNTTYRGVINEKWDKAQEHDRSYVSQWWQSIKNVVQAVRFGVQKSKGVCPSSDKDVRRVFEDLKSRNQQEVAYIDGDLKNAYDTSVNGYYDTPVKTWSADQIREWKEQTLFDCAQHGRELSISELMPVLMRAAELSHKYVSRPVQILSVISCLQNKDQRQFLQVNTGEGKTLITAMLAAAEVLIHNRTVDIMSSSSVLSQKDAQKEKLFFDTLGITSGVLDKSTKDPVGFYRDTIVIYGSCVDTTGDILTQEYTGKATRGDRPYGTLIIDEVDSLLVDRCPEITKISEEIPHMEATLPLQQLIWMRLSVLQSSGDADYIKNELVQLCKDLIAQKTGLPKLYIPEELKDLLGREMYNWIDSAIQAKGMAQDSDYVVVDGTEEKEGKIVPVNREDTGEVEKQLKWSNGLHQFLEIKHGVRLYPQALINALMSKFELMNRYGHHVYGLTGTLGDPATHQFMKDVYQASLRIIPPHSVKQFKEEAPIICQNKAAHNQACLQEIKTRANGGQPVLAICKSIRDAQALAKEFGQIYTGNIQLYHRSDDEQTLKVVDKPLGPGDVIIATNLGGRGTDLPVTQSVNAKDGLHVVVTFLPRNQRVEEQALGRTARQGNPGSGKLILNREVLKHDLNLTDQQMRSIDEIKLARDRKEALRIQNLKLNEVYQQPISDRIFTKMCQYMGSKILDEPIRGHPDEEKLRQLDMLWSLMYHRMTHYKEEAYRNWENALTQQAQGNGLRTTAHTGLNAVDGLYSIMSKQLGTVSPAELKDRAWNHLLGKQYNWTNSQLETFSLNNFDTRNAQKALLEALATISEHTLVVLDQSGNTSVFKPQNSKGVIYIGHVNTQPYIRSINHNLDILKPLYPSMRPQKTAPALSGKQYPGTFCCLIQENPSQSLQTAIRQAQTIRRGFQNRVDDTNRVNLAKHISQHTQKAVDDYWQEEERFLTGWTDKFIADVESIYSNSDKILISAPYISAYAEKQTNTQQAERLFTRVIQGDSPYGRVIGYSQRAHYALKHKVPSHETKSLADFKQAKENFGDLSSLWQNMMIFVDGDGVSTTEFTSQCKGRLAFYEKLIQNLHANEQTVEQCPSDHSLEIKSSEHVDEMHKTIPELLKKDTEQIEALGVRVLDLYEAKAPKASGIDLLFASALDVVQVVAGGLLIAGGFPIGAKIIASGLSSLFDTVVNGVKEAFSWSKYWINKGISAATIFVSEAYNAIRGVKVGVVQHAVSDSVQESIMNAIVKEARGVLVSKALNGMGNFAAEKVLEDCKGQMAAHIRERVDRLFDDQEISEKLTALDVVARLEGKDTLYQKIAHNMHGWMSIQEPHVQALLKDLARECLTQPHDSTIPGLIANGITVANLADYIRRAKGFGDEYIAELRRQIKSVTSQEQTPNINSLFKKAYQKRYHHTCSDEVIDSFVNNLKQEGIIYGDRPYCSKTSRRTHGVNLGLSDEILLDKVVSASKGMIYSATQDEKENLTNLFGELFVTVDKLSGQNFSGIKSQFTKLGTEGLMASYRRVTSETVRMGSEQVATMMSRLRESVVNQTKPEYVQQMQEEADAQAQIATEGVATASQTKVDLEHDTAYTAAISRAKAYIPKEEALASLVEHYESTRNVPSYTGRRRANSFRSTDTWGYRTGRAVVHHTPQVVKNVVGSGLQTAATAIQWTAETFPRTAEVVGNTLRAVDHVTSELPATYTRRILRDQLGVNSNVAQDIGDGVGFVSGLVIPAKAINFAAKSKVAAKAGSVVANAAKASKASVLALDAQAVSTFEKHLQKYIQKLGQPVPSGIDPIVVKPAVNAAQKQGPGQVLMKKADGIKSAPTQIGQASKLLWTSWDQCSKVEFNKRLYAKIGDRLYTRHAIDMMQPSGLGFSAGAEKIGRSCAPGFIEHVIKHGKKSVVDYKGVERSIYLSGTTQVVTELNGKIIITVITK